MGYEDLLSPGFKTWKEAKETGARKENIYHSKENSFFRCFLRAIETKSEKKGERMFVIPRSTLRREMNTSTFTLMYYYLNKWTKDKLLFYTFDEPLISIYFLEDIEDIKNKYFSLQER